MIDENKIRAEIAATDEEILQTRIRIEEINRRMSVASEAERTFLAQRKDYENLILDKQKEALKVNNDILEAQRKIAEAAKDSAEELDSFIDKSSISKSISDELSDRYKSIATKASELSDLAKDNADQVKSVAEFNRKVLEIETVREKLVNAAREGDREEMVIQGEKLESLTEQLNTVIANGSYTEEQRRIANKILQIQKDLAKEHLNTISLTEKELEQYNELTKHADELKAKVKAVGDMLSVFLKKPSTILGGLIIGAGYLADKFGKVNKQLGIGYGSMSGFSASAGLLSFVFDDAAETAKELAHHMGDSRKVTFGMQLDTNVIASNLSLTGTEAAELVSQFGELRGQTHDQAMNMIESAEATAKARGVVPADLMKDLASNTEAFSKYAKGGGENIIAAAAGARQLGMDLKSVTAIADSLLDFENSIEKELELSAMLGKDINLNKARELFYAGDLENATKAVIEQLGDKAEFDKMDVFQKKAAADAIGVQVTELEKMYKNQENISDTSGVISKEYSRLSEYSSYIANEWGGGILKGIGGAVIAVGSFSKGLKDGIDGAKSLGGIVKGLFQKGEGAAEGGGGLLSKLFGSKKPEAPATPTLPTPGAAPAAPGGGAASPADQADKVSKIKSGDLIKGAAALLILAVALYVAAKAFQEFANVTWESVGMGLVALAGLATIAFLLSKVEKDMIAGAIAIGILGAALIPFAFALNMMSNVNGDGLIAAGLALVFFAGAMFALGALLFAGGGLGAVLFGAGIIGLIALGAAMTAFGIGLKSVSEGMSSLTSSLPLIVEQISALSQLNFLPIFGLAAALTALAMALSAVAIAGVLALPALAGIGAIAAGVGGLFGGGEKGGENKELLDEIKGLRADLNSGKVAVYMDGYRVTAAVAAANASSPLTLR